MFKNKLLKNSSTLFLGTLLAFGISFIFNAYFRRVLPDEVFANYEVVFRISSILAVLFSARYGMALVTPEKDEQSFSLFWGANFIASISTVLSFKVLYFYSDQIGLWLGINETRYLFFIPGITFLIAVNQNLNFLFTRLKSFKAQSFFKVFHRVGEGVGIFSLIGSSLNSILIIGDLLGRFLIALFGFRVALKRHSFIFKIKELKIKETLVEYKEYPLFNMFPSLLNTFSLMLPMLLINKYFGEYATSKVGLSFQILAIPLSLLAASVSQVVLQRVSQNRTENQPIGKDVKQLFLLLLASGVLGIIGIQIFGEFIFDFIFGEEYKISGSFSKILVFSVALKLVVSPFSIVLPALNKVKLASFWQLLNFCAILTLYLHRDSAITEFLKYLVGIELVSYLIYAGIIVFQVYKYNKSKSLV